MHYRRLGKSGLKVSEISLGAWVTFGSQVDESTVSDLIHTAYEAGVNFFDNADRDNFLDQSVVILTENSTPCFAWALIPNHSYVELNIIGDYS